MSVANIERPSSIGLAEPLSGNGILGDDERTETERSPQVEKKTFDEESERVSTTNTVCESKQDEAQHDENSARLKGANNDTKDRSANKRHRRGKHKGGKKHGRQWKPYEKLTWDERKELDERETRRACQRRERRFASGQPMAPYNTTQFLMEQNEDGFQLSENVVRPRTNTSTSMVKPPGEGSGSPESSDDYYDSPEDGEMFLTKEFAETYENCHAERLQDMTKEDLVREYLELENKVESLERRVKGLQSPTKDNNDVESGAGGPLPREEEKVDIDVAVRSDGEIIRLRRENEQLRRENLVLKDRGSTTP